jgi:hypothetical protein
VSDGMGMRGVPFAEGAPKVADAMHMHRFRKVMAEFGSRTRGHGAPAGRPGVGASEMRHPISDIDARVEGRPTPFGLHEPGARSGPGVGECEKGIWWMPWHREAMKDVARCEKLGGGASTR